MSGISIHAPLRERLSGVGSVAAKSQISIHAPLRERQHSRRHGDGSENFNPRSLAGATAIMVMSTLTVVFQSTLPCGSDIPYLRCLDHHKDFNPRSLAGATQCADATTSANAISIHAPLRERLWRSCRQNGTHEFQSTLPCGSDISLSST